MRVARLGENLLRLGQQPALYVLMLANQVEHPLQHVGCSVGGSDDQVDDTARNFIIVERIHG